MFLEIKKEVGVERRPPPRLKSCVKVILKDCSMAFPTKY